MADRPPVPVHYLRKNHAEWTPASVIFLDTEAVPIPNAVPEVLTLRLWAGKCVDRRARRNGKQEETKRWGLTAETLVEFINESTKGRPTLWLYAHNLSFDLVTTRLPLLLARDGWEITDVAVGGRAPWMRLRKGSHRLCLADSGGWLPVRLADIADAVGVVKPPLPDTDASDAGWLERCSADVDILAAAILQLMDWWDRGKLGRWTISGASSGWNAFRHVPSLQTITIDPDPVQVAHDRTTVHGGRRGVWQVGNVSDGPLCELDFVAAYPTVAATLALPLRRANGYPSMPLDDFRVTSERWSLAAECLVDTDTPRWPMRTRLGTFYPVGQFYAHLAGPDINEARRLDCLRMIGPGYVYQLGYAMQEWAQWLLSVQFGEHPDSPPAARMAAKYWGRAVIGKWASRAFDRVELGASPNHGWGYEEGWDNESQTRGGMVDIGGRRWWVAASAQPDNAFPAILGWVESHVRVRLGRVIDAVGGGAIVQCDTDGLIVRENVVGTPASGGTLQAPDLSNAHERIDWVLRELRQVATPLTIRVKRRYDNATVLGPQHVEAGGVRRFAGLPSAHTLREDGRYRGHIWPKLQWQMTNGDPRGYVRPETSYTARTHYATGWVTSTNRVIPPRAVINAAGESELLPWAFMPEAEQGVRLADRQHPGLSRLM